MLILAALALLGIGAYAVSQRAGRTRAPAVTDESGETLADQIRDLMAVQPTNAAEANAVALSLEGLARTLEASGYPDAARNVRARAALLRGGGTTFQTPGPGPGGPAREPSQAAIDAAATAMAQAMAPAAPARAPAAPAAPARAPAAPADAQAGLRALATRVAENLRSRGRARYDHALLKSFQRAAGLPDTGTYGTGSYEALTYYGANPPAAFVRTTTHFTAPASA